LYVVSGLPLGSWTVNVIVVGRPAGTGDVGWNPASWKTLAAGITGAFTAVLEPQPATAAATVSTPTVDARRRWITRAPPVSLA
jgi:hypothetical protein